MNRTHKAAPVIAGVIVRTTKFKRRNIMSANSMDYVERQTEVKRVLDELNSVILRCYSGTSSGMYRTG